MVNHAAAQAATIQNNPLIGLMNTSLADSINLKLQVKQAHWNIKGPQFIALHELFDKISGELENYIDMIAERVVQLGGIAQGGLQDVVKHTQLKEQKATNHQGEQYVTLVGGALATYADSTRRLIDKADELDDQVTVDMFTEITRELDKLTWFVNAHHDH